MSWSREYNVIIISKCVYILAMQPNMEIVVPISVYETEMHISTLEDKVFGEIQHAYA